MAPKIEDGIYNYKIDLWSIGVLVYELFYNNFFFKGENASEFFFK